MLSRSVVRETICRIERGFALVAIGLLLMAAPGMDAWAQSLPQPSRTVFRCEVEGKVTYSDSPCLGARRIQIEPTRGVSKLSGSERIGNDVRVERHREIMAEALQPLTGMDARRWSSLGDGSNLDLPSGGNASIWTATSQRWSSAKAPPQDHSSSLFKVPC